MYAGIIGADISLKRRVDLESIYLIIIAFVVFLIISAGAILVLWIAMPFSVFGTKELLRKLIAEQEKTNRLLKSIVDANLQKENPFKGDDHPEKRENTH